MGLGRVAPGLAVPACIILSPVQKQLNTLSAAKCFQLWRVDAQPSGKHYARKHGLSLFV